MKKIGIGGAAATLLLAAPAFADVTILSERTSTQGAAKGPTAVSIQLDADHIRIDGSGDRGPFAMIFDAAAKKMYALHPTEKQYMEITTDDMQRAKSAMQNPAVQQALQERLKSLPPEQRARVEAMMQQQGGMPGATGHPSAAAATHERNLSFTATGDKKTVNGFACQVYKVTDDGKPFEEDCVASWSASTISKDDVQAFKKIAESMKSMIPAGRSDMQVHDVDRYPGFPIVRSRLGEDGKVVSVETVKSIKHGAIAANTFQVPAGYTKRMSPMGRAGHGEAGGPAAE